MTTSPARSIAGLTDVGQLRQINEDALLINNEVQLYAIADGMGGHGSGDVASQLAVDTLQSCVTSDSVSKALAHKDISDKQAQGLIYQCIVDVNQRIYQENVRKGHPDGTGMGTTLVGYCVFGDAGRAVLFNIGDSRLYEYQDEKLAQLTTDHTMYRDWEESGRIGPAPPRNIIMRAIGLFADIDIDMEILDLHPDATYLICSDGLTGMITDERIADILASPDDVQTISETLVQNANEQGGTDNITVVTLAPSPKN